MNIKKVTDPEFKAYGKVVRGYDCRELLEAMEKTPLPEDVIYVASVKELEERGIECEPIRLDPYSQRRFTFFHDPDGLPLELHE